MINTIHNAHESAKCCILRNLFVFICIPIWCLANVSTANAQTTIWSNPINGSVNSNNAFTSGQTVAPHLTVSGISKSSSLTSATTTGAFRATSWPTNTGLNTSYYFEFTLTPTPGYAINLSQFVFEGQRGSSGPKKFALRSSSDNFSANIGTIADQSGTGAFTGTITLTDVAFQNIFSEPITFRLYAWNAPTGASASSRQFQVNSFSFFGTIAEQPAALWRNPIIGNTNSQAFNTGNVTAANITVGGVVRGGGLSSVNGTHYYAASGWSTSSSNITNNDYLQFTITPAPGYVINLESFSFNAKRLTGGPRSFALRTSLDNFSANVSSIAGVTNTSLFQRTVNMSGITSTGTITIRLYGYNAQSSSSNNEFHLYDFVFQGNVTPMAAPTISSFYPTNGCAVYGESFTINGDNFHQVSDVKINGVSVPFNALSTSQILVTVAEGTSTGYITVTAINGTATSSEEFTVYESGYDALLEANFDNNSLNGWTTSSTNSFTITTSSPISGSRSLYSSSSNWSFLGSDVASSYISTPMTDLQPLHQNKTIWRFNTHLQASASSFLAADFTYDVYYMVAVNGNNLHSNSLNGYAIRFQHDYDYFIIGSNNYSVGLFKIQNGTPHQIGSTYVFNFNGTTVGVELTRTADGEWTLKLDNNGGFDNLVTRITATDTQFSNLGFFGIRTRLVSAGIWTGVDARLRLDDLSITQGYCEEIYYSQGNGTAHSSIWQRERQGMTALAVTNSPRTSFVVQAGDTITMTNEWVGKHFIIEPNGSLQITEKKTLTLHGNLTVQGNFSTGNSTLSFFGNQPQEISATQTLNLYDVVLNNHHSLNLPANVVTNIKANGSIIINSGTLYTNDNLVLRSTAAGTASIGTIGSTASVNGKVTQERFLPNLNAPASVGNGSWIAVGTPLLGATVAQWNETVVTTGFAGSDYPAPGYTFNNIQWYDESAPGNINNGYVGVSHVNEEFRPDKGYFFYTYANLPSPQNVLRAKGYIQQGTIIDTVSYTATGNPDDDGWNLLVNRYPSEVDFKAIAEAGSGTIRMYYLFDAETNNYKIYHTAAAGTAPRYIASGQAFFVKAEGPGGTLEYRETFKTRTGVAFERSEDEDASYAAIRFFKSGNSSDECVINFNNDATGNYEYEFDAKKLPSQEAGAAECALVSEDGIRLSIDSRPLNAQGNITIPVYVKMPNNGTYRLRIQEVKNLPLGSCLMIEDLVTGNTIPFVEGQELVISHTGNYSGNRFLIHATPGITTTVANLDCNNANNGSISLEVPQGEWNITLTDSLGHTYTAEEGTYNFINLPAHVYTISATPAGCISTSKTIEVSEPAAVTFEALASTIDYCNSGQNGALAWKVNNAPSYDFFVKNSHNEVVAQGTTGSGIKIIEGLSADVYTVLLQSYCGAEEFTFDLRDNNVVIVEILSDDMFFDLTEGTSQNVTIEQTNANATSFQWTLSNGFVSNDDVFSYEFSEPGVYTLTLVANSATCSATDSIDIVVDRAVNITEIDEESHISVIKTSGSLEVYFNFQSSEKTTLSVYDMTGKLVWNMTTSTWKGKNISIGTGSMPAGVYVLKVTNNNEELIQKKFINP